MNREIKFRQPLFVDSKFHSWHFFGFINDEFRGPSGSPKQAQETSQQFTGLKDKNGSQEVYEGDIIDSKGAVVGNYYENNTLLENGTNFLVTGLCSADWRDAEAEATKRGCQYAK